MGKRKGKAFKVLESLLFLFLSNTSKVITRRGLDKNKLCNSLYDLCKTLAHQEYSVSDSSLHFILLGSEKHFTMTSQYRDFVTESPFITFSCRTPPSILCSLTPAHGGESCSQFRLVLCKFPTSSQELAQSSVHTDYNELVHFKL